jgi:hypothetical protein
VKTKEDLLQAAAREYQAFHEALRGLNEEQMSERWLGIWSVREIVGHMSGWHREMAPALRRLAQGERPVPEGSSYDDVDGWNANFAAAVKDKPVAQVMLDLDRSHEDFMHAAMAVPGERYQPGKTAWKIVDSTTAHHYKEHGDQVRAWRRSRGL